MSLQRSDSAQSTCTVLTVTPENYENFYHNETFRTEVLSDDVLRNVICPNRERLRAADNRYRLDNLLIALLEHAPHPLGQRYIALSLHVAHQKGVDGVVDAAKAWLDGMLLPMLAISKATKTECAFIQTPTDKTIVQEIESSSRAELRILRDNVARREQYYCAITKVFDRERVFKLGREGRKKEIPDVGQHQMEAAHIIPFLLPLIAQGSKTDATRTLDMLQSWTQIDFGTLGANIKSPMNAIYMTGQEYGNFTDFNFFLEKESSDHPNKYKARMYHSCMRFSNGAHELDVEFPTREESSVEPPNPYYLKVHAAFANVLQLCEAVDYIWEIERGAKMEGTLPPNGETDFVSFLGSNLATLGPVRERVLKKLRYNSTSV